MSSFRAYYDHTDCFQELYNITAATKAAKGNELGIFEDLGDVYAQEDLDLFFAAFAQYASFESLQFQSSNSIIEAFPKELDQRSRQLTARWRPTQLPVLAPNLTWTSKCRIPSYILRTLFCSKPTTQYMRPTIPSKDSSTTSSMRLMDLTAATSTHWILLTPILATSLVHTRANCNAASTSL